MNSNDASRFIWLRSRLRGISLSHRHPHLSLDALESAIAAELEGFYLRQHGEEKGRQIACALLEDLMESGPLKAAPSLSFLGLAMMDELCARHITSPVLH